VQNSGFQTTHHARKLIKSLRRFSILKWDFAASFKDEKEEVFKEFYKKICCKT
jgi:hypothetical protein